MMLVLLVPVDLYSTYYSLGFMDGNDIIVIEMFIGEEIPSIYPETYEWSFKRSALGSGIHLQIAGIGIKDGIGFKGTDLKLEIEYLNLDTNNYEREIIRLPADKSSFPLRKTVYEVNYYFTNTQSLLKFMNARKVTLGLNTTDGFKKLEFSNQNIRTLRRFTYRFYNKDSDFYKMINRLKELVTTTNPIEEKYIEGQYHLQYLE